MVVDDVAAEDLSTNQQNWYTFILTHLKEAIDEQDQTLGGGRSHEVFLFSRFLHLTLSYFFYFCRVASLSMTLIPRMLREL